MTGKPAGRAGEIGEPCRYTGTYPADSAQVRHARAALAALFRDCPHADDAILIVSEFADPQNWGVDGDTDGRTAWATLGK